MNKTDYYSQNGEDLLLSKFFRKKKKGFFIEVGAFDGVHLSNTYYFEKLGWKGVCIEAHPKYFQLCKLNRPNSICLHAACIGDESIMEVTFSSEKLGLLSGIDEREDIQQRYDGRGLKFEGFKKVNVKAITLNRVLNEQKVKPEIDLISIDVEGYEIEVLKGLDFETYHPSILLVEANTPEDEAKLDEFLVVGKAYFKARRLVENVIYCRNLSDVEKIMKINIKNFVRKSSHPLGENYDIRSKSSNDVGIILQLLNRVKGIIK